VIKVNTAEFIRGTLALIILVAYTIFGANTRLYQTIAAKESAPLAVTYEETIQEQAPEPEYTQSVPTATKTSGQAPVNVKPKTVAVAVKTEAITEDVITTGEELVVPYLSSDFKAYMGYDMVTNRTAPQWKYREMAVTDENGLRRIGEDYLVAMGTYYTEEVGARFRITLDSGSVITVTVGDIKNPEHTDKYNMYTPIRDKSGNIINANVLEFIVDTKKLNSRAAKLGTVSCIDGLEGDVEKIERINEKQEQGQGQEQQEEKPESVA
jgi:hypothetical protein